MRLINKALQTITEPYIHDTKAYIKRVFIIGITIMWYVLCVIIPLSIVFIGTYKAIY